MSKITVALLVYNEEAYLAKSLESICAAAPCDCEILVGNNASTDRSSEIIDSFVRIDPRVIHIKRDINVGALDNWRDLVRRSSGDYFVLAGGHDLWVGDYLGELSRALDNNPNAVISYCKTEWINDKGSVIDRKEPLVDTSGLSSVARFAFMFFMNQHALYGMIRLSILKSARLDFNILGSGEILLQDLVQRGDFIIVEGIKWQRRIVRNAESSLQRFARYSHVLFSSDSLRKRFRFFPTAQMMICYILLPFFLKNISLFDRIKLLMFIPVILIRFIPGIIVADIPWLIRGIK